LSRKYTKVTISFRGKSISDIIAFIDTGSDLSIISRNIAKDLRIKLLNIERIWTASDGKQMQSPITEIDIRAEDDAKSISLDEVLIDDHPIDKESGEQAILGLDYLQKGKKTLKFED